MFKNIDVLFIGSSIISRWQFNNEFTDYKIINIGIDGLKTSDIIEPQYLSKIIKLYPKYIIYYCGGIDISKNITIKEIINNITIFIKMIKYIYGTKTKLIILSIIASPKKIIENKRLIINYINKELNRICYNNNVYFISLNKILNNKVYFDKDLNHLNINGYKILNKIILSIIK